MEDKWSKPPSIPPNFVTILELQERWIKEQKRKQNKEQEPEPEPETKPQEQGGIGDVVEEHEGADAKLESKMFKKNKRTDWLKKKEKKREARALAKAEGAKEDENDVAGSEAHAPERKEARVRKMSTGSGSGREKEGAEGPASLIVSQITSKWREASKSKRNQKQGERKKVNEEKVEEKVAGGEAHAPKVSGEKEEKAKSGNADVADQTFEIEGKFKDVSINGGRVRRNDKPVGTNIHNRDGHPSGEKEERVKSGNAVVVDEQTVEIEGKLKDMPTHGGRGRENGRLARPNNGGYYKGGRPRFENERRREEWKQGNAGMVWVKKGDASGGNAGDVQGSGSSINESA